MSSAGRHAARLMAMLMAVALAACDDSGPVAPTGVRNSTLSGLSPASFAGTWVGTVASTLDSSAPAAATLTFVGPAADGSYTGTWSIVFDDASLNRQGVLTSTAPESRNDLGLQLLSVSATLTPRGSGSCVPAPSGGFVPDYRMDVALFSADRLSGHSRFAECARGVMPGRVELSRQKEPR
jgi:hypothetical protein